MFAARRLSPSTKRVVRNPKIAVVGDSISQYGMRWTAPTGTLSRAGGTGLITVPITSHQIYGSPMGFISNATDKAFQITAPIVNSIDANNVAMQSANTNASTTTAAGVNVFNGFNPRGHMFWLRGYFNNWTDFKGVYAHFGFTADSMMQYMTYALAQKPDAVIIEGGVNNIYGGSENPLLTFGKLKTLIEMCTSAGAIAIVLAVPPALSTYPFWTTGNNTNAMTLNAMLAAYCASNPSRTIFVDCFTPLYDSTNHCAQPWATPDGIHWTSRAAKVVTDAIKPVLTSLFAFTDMLQTAATPLDNNCRWQKMYSVGPWNATGGGGLQAPFTGSGPNNSYWYNDGAMTSGVCSIPSDVDGKGYWAQIVCSASGAGLLQYYPLSTGNTPLATFGYSIGDTIGFGCEVDVAGAQAANIQGLSLYFGTNASGSFGNCFAGGSNIESTATYVPDAFRLGLFAGPFTIQAGTTGMGLNVEVDFRGASSSPLTLKIRRCCAYKYI